MTTGVVNVADLNVGDDLPSLSFTMSLGHMRLFSGWPDWAKMGRNPVNQHTSPEMAEKVGRPAPIVQGLQMSACVEEMLINSFGMDWFSGGKIMVYYVGITIPGDVITAKGKIIEKTPQEDGKTLLEMEVWGENQRAAKVTVGFASIAV